MVDSCYCPGRSGGDEPGVEPIRGYVHKRRALNTRLSSGTSAGTFVVSAGPYRNYQAETGTKNEPDTFFVPLPKKGWKLILTFRSEVKIAFIIARKEIYICMYMHTYVQIENPTNNASTCQAIS